MIMRSRRIPTALSLAVAVIVALGAGASPALAETHPFVPSFGSFTNPNGIAVEESTGDVYVADIGTTRCLQVRRRTATRSNFPRAAAPMS